MSTAALLMQYTATSAICSNVIIIKKRISRAPIYRSRWEHRALCNDTNNTHRHACTCTHTHTNTCQMGGIIGMVVKKTV